jgi:hypothetical protein
MELNKQSSILLSIYFFISLVEGMMIQQTSAIHLKAKFLQNLQGSRKVLGAISTLGSSAGNLRLEVVVEGFFLFVDYF